MSVFTLSVFGARIKGFASAWAGTAGAAVQNRLSIKIGVKESTTLWSSCSIPVKSLALHDKMTALRFC